MFNELIAKALPHVPKKVVHWAAKKYVAGETLEEAVNLVQELNQKRILATMDVLGEFVSDRDQAKAAFALSTQVLDAIHGKDLGSGVSVKLTSMGLDIDDDFCYQNLKTLVSKARDFKRFVRIDMENSPYTTRTLAQFQRLRADGFENTGVVIQAYMRRSLDDLKALAPLKTPVRLCKGIYREAPEVAFQGRQEVRDNYKTLLTFLLENGMHAAIATHDDELIDFAREKIATLRVPKDRYEFQMLLGVRESKRDELVSQGHRMRIYVPFGKDWYGYSIRRLKENPEMAGTIMKAFLTGE